uniref:Uncharacterized protein n=1 Tax=Steinernema glaseri TaxID=37863 RepID=A0A1I7ZB33_9BILA
MFLVLPEHYVPRTKSFLLHDACVLPPSFFAYDDTRSPAANYVTSHKITIDWISARAWVDHPSNVRREQKITDFTRCAVLARTTQFGYALDSPALKTLGMCEEMSGDKCNKDVAINRRIVLYEYMTLMDCGTGESTDRNGEPGAGIGSLKYEDCL